MGWLAVEAMALRWVCLRITVFLVVLFHQGRLLFPYWLSTAPKIEEKNQGSRQVTQADLSISDTVMSQGPFQILQSPFELPWGWGAGEGAGS